MSNTLILDCTLRDGAHINKGHFGQKEIISILQGLVGAHLDMIEVGFLQKCAYNPDSTFFNNVVRVDNILNNFSDCNSKFGLMIRTDRCDIGRLISSKYISFIRIAFYKEHVEQVKNYTKMLKNLGYNVFLNPIALTTYSKKQIEILVETLISISPEGIFIVDTFGALKQEYFLEIIQSFDILLPKKMALGIHLHENLSLSLSLSLLAIKNISDRKIIIDTSVLGMGRIPGNLPTELLLHHINSDRYNIESIFSIIDIIQNYKTINAWGYNPIYMHSAILNIDRSYPEFFNNKDCSCRDNIILQNRVKKSQCGDRFNHKQAEQIFQKFKENNATDF